MRWHLRGPDTGRVGERSFAAQRDPHGRRSRSPRAACAIRWCSRRCASVPRERFLPGAMRATSPMTTRPVPIAGEQTISQPYIVASMIEALAAEGRRARARDRRRLRLRRRGARPGSPARSITVERHRRRSPTAPRAALAALGLRNVEVLHGDGSLGWPEHAPLRRDRGRGRRSAGAGFAESAARRSAAGW